MNEKDAKRLLELNAAIETVEADIARRQRRLQQLKDERAALLHPEGTVWTAVGKGPDQRFSI